MPFDKNRSAGYLVNHLARLFANRLAQRIKVLGIVPGQFPALLELWSEDGLTQRELVRRLDVEQATMANTLNRMVRDGLVERLPHPEDGRSTQVWLTKRGKALERDATREAGRVNAEALGGLSKAEREQFLQLGSRVLATLRECQGTGSR